MGNEGSMEGGEGMGGFPEGMAGDGKGGFAQIPAGMQADLSQLSEEERKQIAAVMSRAQELPRGNQTDRPPLRYPNIDTNQSPRHPSKPPDPGPTGLSKSRTVDAFKTEMKTPGRSPSTMSLKEPRSKPEIKEEQKPSMMTGFLTDSNPLSVVSSVVNKLNPFDAKSDPGANQEENLKKQKEHEKIEDPGEKVKPPHLLQQSPGHTQHSQHPQGPVKSTDTITPTQQQPSKSSQSGPKLIPLQQSTSKFPTQSSSTTKPSSHTPPPKEPLSHVKDPIKPVAQESKHTTSSSQFQGPKKETIKHDQSVTHGPMDMGKQNMQQSRPLTQSRYSLEVAKGPPHTTEPAKKLIKEPEKQPTQPQGPAKQIMQQAGPTGKTIQQAINMKQPIQQTLPLQQQTITSMTSKQTAQKPEPSKPPDTKQSSQSPRKPTPGLNQSAKMLPQQQDKFPEKIPEPEKQQQDSTLAMSKVSEKTICPLCSTTELLLNTNEKANYNTCTQCHTTVCSLCGFNPNPHMTEIHEWLCLNCQMQRALDMDKNPPPSKPSPVKKKHASAVPSTKHTPESSQRKQSISAPEQNLAQGSKVATPVLTKQRSVTESPTSKSKKSFEPQTGNVPSKAELMEKPQQLSPENKQQQTKPEERACDMPSSQVVPTKLDSLLPKVTSSPGKKDIDSKTRDTSKPEKSQLVEKLSVSQPVVQELHQSSASSTHPKLPQKPETSKLEEDPKSSPSKINPNLNGKQVQKEAQVQPSPKPSPSHKPVVSQTMSHAQSEVQKDPLVQPSPKPSPSRKPVVPQTMSRTQPQVQKDSQALPSPKPSPSNKPVVPQSTSHVQPKVQKDPQVQPSPKPSPSHKPVIPQMTSQVQPQVQKDPHVQPSPKPSPSHKPVIPQTTSQAQPQVQNDSNVQQSPKPSPSRKPVIPQTTSQAQPQVQNDLNVQQSPKSSPSHKPVVIQTMSQAQSQVQKDQKIQPGPKPSPSHKPVGPQATPQPQPDKSQGQPRRFSLNLGSTTETHKHQPTTPQGTVTGKLFGFGASIFSQASSFISTATQPSNQMQNTQGSTAKQPPSQQAAEPPTTAKDAMHDKQLHPPQKSSELPKTAKEAPLPKQPHPAQKTSELPKQPVHAPQSSKPQVVKKEAEALPVEKTEDSKDSLIAKEAEHKMETKKETTTGLPKMEKIPNLKKLCPLCETELNIGSKDLPNFNKCTQCKNVVCNMCGFNPTPHLTEVVEWLCLNCQTHRAMTGQLVDLSKTSPPLGAPSKSSPKHTISLENQKEIHKVTTSSFTASLQSVTEVISKMSNEKVAMVPEEKSSVIPEEKISIGGSKKVDVAPEGIVVKASEEKADITPSLPVEKTGILSEGKPSLIPVQLIEQEIDKDKLLLSLSEKVKKSVALPGEEVFPSKDINSLVPMEIKGIKPPEGKIMPKQDLMIDLSATLLKQIDEGTLENRIKPKPSQLIENEAGREKTEKEDDKSDTSSSQQQKSPQGLSDTGYSSDGISGSLGEIPSLIPSDEKDLHKEPSKRETFSHENSPSSPSDLAKLESTVLSILEAQTSMLIDEKSRKSNDLYGIYGGQTRVRTKILPITPESFSSEEEELEDIQEEDEEILGENGKGIVSRKSHKDGLGSVRDITSRQRHDSLDDSSESENSPVPQRKRRISNGSSSSDDYKHEDSQGSGDDEDFIRKQIIEMSADEDASGSEDEEFIRTKLKEISGSESQKAEAKTKPVAAKCKRLTKKSSASYDDDGIRRHSWHHGDEEDEEIYDEIPEPKYRESKSQESEELSVSGGGGLRRFKTIELNSTISNTYSEEPCKQTTRLYYDEEPELEMESLTDSPEERSREERSSSLHASSFTPGTSPTSVSSLDEDSDSSPSHKKISGESKQQRKARHRSHGPVLPTIEDSSEEEELREEEELLKEQEKQRELEQQQRKGSSKKSKKDKDELRAQRRRERPKTPPSNLSPIEDASPTEELRQAAEMEELHRSSCSEYSPSIESEPEGFEISPEKIIEVQKVYKLPTSVSLYSPTDVTTGAVTEKKNGQRSLKNAEEAYEEILYKAKLYQTEKEKDEVFEREPLYGGMLIEDYIYESLVEENYDESLDTNALSSQENVFDSQVSDLKNLTDDIRIDSVEKIIHFENECYTTGTFHTIVPQEDIVSSSYIVPESHEIIILDNVDERQPEDTDTGFHDYISCQNMQLTPGSSPTQVRADFSIKTGYAQSVPADITSSLANVISIPDVKITQHFTTEEPEEDTITDYTDQKMQDSAVAGSPAKSEECVSTSVLPAIKDSDSMELRNLDQQPVIKPEKYTGSALSTGLKERETDDNVMCAATSSSTCPGSNQIYSYTAHTTQPSLASETTSVEHVIISVPEATTEITQTAGACSFDQEQGRKDVTKVMENISEKKGETYDLQNYVTPRTVECSLLTKQSTSVTDTITSSPNLQSAASTVTSVTSKVESLFRSSSSESTVPLTTPTPPPPPPLPPPTPSKPTVYSKKRPAPKVPSMEKNAIKGSTNETSQGEISLKNNATIVSKHHAPPPPVPPKPSSIPAGLVFSHRPTENRVTKARLSEQPTVMQKMQGVHDNTATLPATMSLNLIPSTECKLPSPTSPLSPHSNKSSPRWTKPSLETYVVITLPSEPGTPTDNVATDTTCWPLQAPPQEQVPQTAETVFSIMSLSQGETIQASFDSHPVPSPLSQVITTVSTKAAMSKASDLDSTATILQAECTSQSKQNAKASKSNNVIDLRTLSKIDNANNDLFMGICMDLSSAPLDAKRQSTSQGVSGRLVSAVQPAVVNLCSESTAMSSVLLPTEPYSIVTCSTTLGYTTSLESIVDLGNSMKAPLKLTSKQHEQASVGLPVEEEVPINLSMGMPAQSVISATAKHGSFSPNSITNGCTDISTSQESIDSGVVDLSTTKSHKTIVTVDETTSAIITEIIEDDKPVDLTAGRRAVCCDVVYKLPFGRSCISQQSSTNLPEDRFGYRDDHYQYDRSGMAGLRGVGGMKPSMSDTNLAEAGLFLYKSKNTFDYPIGVTEVAVDLTSGKMTTGEALDYKTKITSAYPETRQVISGIGMSAPQYSQARMTASILPPFGMGSVLRSSNGVVYSSVATPIPSTFAITTQPGSIFSTTVKDLSSFVTSDTVTAISSLNQTQPPPRSYNILNTTSADVTDVMTAVESGFAVEVEATTAADLVSVMTTEPESFSELTEDESAFLMPPEDGKQQQLHLQRELLELEKIKQQRLAEELEWERQEIQRFREQETFMVQKKLEELQSMKQQLLFQQEEERQAQYMMRQETLVQQQLHIEQIQQLQQQLHQQLEEQKLRQMYQYSYDTNETASPQTTSDQGVLEGQFSAHEDGQFWTSDHTSTAVSGVAGIEMPPSETWYTVQSDGITQYISRPGILNSISEMSLKDVNVTEERQLKKRSSMQRLGGMYDELDVSVQEEPKSYKLIVDSGVQTDDEDGGEKGYTGRRRRSKKGVDTSVQTDDEDQDEWDIPTRSRRRSRAGKYSEGNTDADKVRQFSKVSSRAVQTVAESSVQTEPLGTIRIPSVRAQVDAKVEIVKHISAPEKSYKGESLGCQTETDGDSQSPQYLTNMPQKDKRRPTPLEIGYSNHLRAESSLQVAPSPPKSPKVLYSPISPVSPGTVLESAFVPYEKTIVDDIACQHTDINLVPPPSPKSTKVIQRSLSDPKPLSPTSEDNARTQFQYSDGYMTKTLSGTQKKVKRTLPNPPPEEASNGIQSPYNAGGSVSRRRICRNTTMARAKILQDIDRELDLVERESSKLRKKQAELDEEEKEIDAKLRYLEMGINRRKEALLKEREKRERAYLQGVAEERDYMSDSEVSSTRPTRIESHLGLDRPQTAAPTEYSPYLTPQTQSETHFVPPTSPYTQFQYQTPTLLTQAPTQYSQQSHYEQPLYHQQVSSYQTQPSFQDVPTMSFTSQQPAPTQQPSYKQHQSQMILMQQKRQGALDLDCKLTTHYDVIRNQPLIITPASTDNSYSVPHLGSKYSTLDLRLGLDEKSSMASSPMSSISADSFYADLDHHTSRNYVLIDDIGELTKGSGSLSSAFGLHEKELSKADRILRSVDARRTPEVTDFLAPITSSARLHSYGKADEDSMEDPYELKLLKHQIKQEFRRGTENLDPLVGYSPYYHSDSLYRHFPKTEKYSISRLTLEKQAAKQLPPAILYQKQSKHKKAVIDPKIAKFSPIQESRDIEPDYSSYLSSSTSSIPSISSKVRLLQDDITYGLRKNITDQQKFLGPALAQNLGASLSPTLRTSMQDEVDKPYVSGSRSRPSSRPSSIYGLDLSIKRDSSSSSLRLKANEAETLDGSFSHVAPSGRTKPSSLPISQSRGRIPIVAQNSEEESPLSPVGQPMGMARASAGPLPPISADSRDQFGSSHSLPEVQQHMREESRTRGYDRDIAFIMDDFQHAMSDSEAYHLRREETDWFDKPRESRIENGHGIDRKLPDKLSHARSSLHHEQVNGKPIHYAFPHLRIKLQKDPKDHTVSGNGFGIRVVGGKEVPGNYGEIGAYIAKILPGGDAEHTGRLTEGMQVLEWNGYSLTGKTYEDVQSIIGQSSVEAEICVRLDLNMLSNSETPQNLELHEPTKPVDKTKSPGVDPKQLAAELQKVSQQQAPSAASAVEKGSYIHSGTTSAASSAVPSPGQPGSPSVSKKRHSSKSTEAIKSHSHAITGEIQLQVNYDKHLGNLIIHILQARNLVPRDNNGYSDPFVKVYLLPGRGAEYKRRTKHVQKSLNPEWNQTVIYKNISMEQLKKKTLEVTIWDYDRFSSNDFLGEVLIDLSNPSSLDNIPRWYQLKEQSESIDHAKPHSSQSNQQVPKPSVIKSRSHGIFPDPSKDMQIPTIEKSHSSPGSSKSSSEGHLRSHGPSRSQSKTSVTQTHLEDAGAAIAAAEAAVQQLRLQPTAHKSGQSNHARKQHRHSIAGVLPIQRTQSDNLPPPANDSKDQSQLALKKVNSDGSVKTEAKSTTQKPVESSVSTASSVSSFGSGCSMDSDGSNTTGDSNLFPAPRIGKINQNGQDLIGQSGIPLTDVEGKTQVMGEIKIALKKEMKTDGEQLIVEILQCRNITYKFKSPDHLPDLYVKLYVINIATQKRIIKKKTRVCRHDREPSFNETFRFSMSPAGHSLQILLVSNGGKFMKKTLIGEAYIWLDKVDLRKRIVNWHKLLVSSTQTH